MTYGGESALKWHAGLASFEGKGKNLKLRTPVTGSGSLGLLKKPESGKVTTDSVKKESNSNMNNQPTQLSITAALEKNFIDAEIRWCLKVVKSNFLQRFCNDVQSLFRII